MPFPRYLVIALLCCLGCEQHSTDQLVSDLADASSAVRRKAAYRLVDQGSTAVEPLIAAMDSGSDTLRYIGAQVLGRIGSPRAENALRALAHDPNTHIAKEAVLALSKIHVPALLDTVRQFLLSSPHADLRAAAAEGLPGFRDTSATHVLQLALGDSIAIVRQSALAAINKIWSPSAAPAVLRSMRDPDEKVRYIATQIAAIRPIDDALPLLRAALQDPSEWVRLEAVRGISARGDTASAEALLDLLKQRQGPDAEAARKALQELTGIDYVIE